MSMQSDKVEYTSGNDICKDNTSLDARGPQVQIRAQESGERVRHEQFNRSRALHEQQQQLHQTQQQGQQWQQRQHQTRQQGQQKEARNAEDREEQRQQHQRLQQQGQQQEVGQAEGREGVSTHVCQLTKQEAVYMAHQHRAASYATHVESHGMGRWVSKEAKGQEIWVLEDEIERERFLADSDGGSGSPAHSDGGSGVDGGWRWLA
jgi:hypothetical protein